MAAAVLLIAAAAFGDPGPASPAAGEPASTDLHGAQPAPGDLELAPQESRALGPASRPIGARRAARGRDGAGALDPRIGEIARVGWALGVVVALVLVLRVMVRRLGGPMAGGGRPSGVLEVLARYPAARGQQLVLLKLADRVVLLHQTRTGMTALSEVSAPDEVAALLARVGSSESRGG
jgi:flagellar biogenesis protein FliO